jgi:TPR repeat protein
MNHLIVSFLVALFAPNVLALASSELAMKSRGIILYNQHKAISAIPLLVIAAKAGDHEAQYYLAESLRAKSRFMTPEAKYWYEAAALQDDLYAMIQLGRNGNDFCEASHECERSVKQPVEWLNQAKKLAQQKADNGDAESMYLMYEITLEDSWLERAANAGDVHAQYWMAVGYKQGDGFFLPWNRAKEVEKWFKLSAENGNPRSMMEYAAMLFEKGDIAGFRHWNEQAAMAGYAESVYGYGSYLAHEPDTYGFAYNPVKGYSLVSSLVVLDGGGGMQENVEYKLPLISAKMTPSQISAAEELTKSWDLTHPPLSSLKKLSR